MCVDFIKNWGDAISPLGVKSETRDDRETMSETEHGPWIEKYLAGLGRTSTCLDCWGDLIAEAKMLAVQYVHPDGETNGERAPATRKIVRGLVLVGRYHG